jgi:predicted dienelactone hydrolase
LNNCVPSLIAGALHDSWERLLFFLGGKIMKRYWGILCLLILLLTVSPLDAQSGRPRRVGIRPDAPQYALHGPYWVGTRELIIGEGTERSLPATIWYPALNPDRVEEATTYDMGINRYVPLLSVIEGRAIRDAMPDTAGAPYPLVVWSHSWAFSRLSTTYLVEHLASQGFVVIGVDHTDYTIADLLTDSTLPERKYAELLQRPRDITTEIDYISTLNTAGDFQDMIDLDQIAVIGYSIGGYTALVEGGARLDMNYYTDWCVDHQNDLGCKYIPENLSGMVALAGQDAVPEGLWPPQRDERVEAIIGIGPGTTTTIGPRGANSITTPTLLMGGTADSYAPPEEDILMIYENIQAEKTLVMFEGADHLFALLKCNQAWLEGMFGDLCYDPTWDTDRAHDLVNHFVTAFLLSVLKDDADAAAALAPENVDFPSIQYKTTGY